MAHAAPVCVALCWCEGLFFLYNIQSHDECRDLFHGLRAMPKGLLLFGCVCCCRVCIRTHSQSMHSPPGTGKTLIGKCIAHKVCNCLWFEEFNAFMSVHAVWRDILQHLSILADIEMGMTQRTYCHLSCASQPHCRSVRERRWSGRCLLWRAHTRPPWSSLTRLAY